MPAASRDHKHLPLTQSLCIQLHAVKIVGKHGHRALINDNTLFSFISSTYETVYLWNGKRTVRLKL